MPQEIIWNKITTRSYSKISTLNAVKNYLKTSACSGLYMEIYFCSESTEAAGSNIPFQPAFHNRFQTQLQEEHIALICSQINRWRQLLEKKPEASSPKVTPACLLLLNHFKAENNWKKHMWNTLPANTSIIWYKINCLGASSKLIAFAENDPFYIV